MASIWLVAELITHGKYMADNDNSTHGIKNKQWKENWIVDKSQSKKHSDPG